VSQTTPEMRCPRCHSPMVTFRRSGINIDQCTGCSGIFLDRGELEQLMAAEDGHYASDAGFFYPEPEGQHRRHSRDRRSGFLRALLGDR
jgi:uncharacterized protein